ncbi:MAG TPA: hypothetical protein PLW47_03380 [Sphaerochaeta sp.]|nr:hypothetical protein [Sphaerochaeta sp.]
MKKLLLLAILIPLLLVSCRSAKDLQGSGVPSWTSASGGRANQVFFFGEGTGLDPYHTLFKNLEESIGFDLDPGYLTELVERGRIDDLGLVITNRYRKGDEIFLQARASEEAIDRLRTELSRQRQARVERIETLLREANLAYKANNDTTTIARYLEAAAVASSGPVGEKDYETEVLVAEAIRYIEPLQLVLTRSESSYVRTIVTLRRRTRLLAPRVLHAPISATFEAYNALGALYEDTLFFNSHETGQLHFSPLNAAMKNEGIITFALNLEIPPLPAALALQVEEAVKKVSIEFPYVLSSALGSEIGLSLEEYSINGGRLPTAHAKTAFSESSKRDEIPLVELTLERAGEDELDDLVRQIPKNIRYTVIGSVGVLSFDKALDDEIAVVSGSFILYDSVRAEILYHSQDIEAVGWGATQEEAEAIGFERFGSIAEYLLRTVLMELR